MKLAKAEEKDFDKVYGFINVMDDLFDSRFFSHEEDWRDWPDDDEDKKLLLEIEKEIRETDGEDVWSNVDNRLILYEFVKRGVEGSQLVRFFPEDSYRCRGFD